MPFPLSQSVIARLNGLTAHTDTVGAASGPVSPFRAAVAPGSLTLEVGEVFNDADDAFGSGAILRTIRLVVPVIIMVALTGCAASTAYRVYSNDERALAACERSAGLEKEEPTRAERSVRELRIGSCLIAGGKRAALPYQYTFRSGGNFAAWYWVSPKSPKTEAAAFRDLATCWNETGRGYREDTKGVVAPAPILHGVLHGFIDKKLPPCLERLGYSVEEYRASGAR